MTQCAVNDPDENVCESIFMPALGDCETSDEPTADAQGWKIRAAVVQVYDTDVDTVF
jgi:hypothetical protein